MMIVHVAFKEPYGEALFEAMLHSAGAKQMRSRERSMRRAKRSTKIHAQHDWTTGPADNGNHSNGMEENLRRTSLAPLTSVASPFNTCFFSRSGNRRAFSLPEEGGDHFIVWWHLRPVIFGADKRKPYIRVVEMHVLEKGVFVSCRKQAVLTKSVKILIVHSTHRNKGFCSSTKWQVSPRQNDRLSKAPF